MTLDDLPLRTVLDQTADAYETLAALPPAAPGTGGRTTGKPGSRLPPGVQEILDAEEHTRAVTDVDDWTLFVVRVLIDEEPGIGKIPDHTPGRLRLAARWTDRIESLDHMLVYALRWDAVEHLKTLRRLVRRSNRVVRTGSPCLLVTCTGSYEAVIDGPDCGGDLVCDRCRDRVPHDRWRHWGAQSEWVTVGHAASLLEVPVNTVRVWAHRYHWRRTGTGRGVRYRTEDVTGRRETSA